MRIARPMLAVLAVCMACPVILRGATSTSTPEMVPQTGHSFASVASLSPNGQFIAILQESIKLFNKHGILLRSIAIKRGTPRPMIRFSPDSKHLSISVEAIVYVYDLEGKLVASSPPPRKKEDYYHVRSFDFLANSDTIAFSSSAEERLQLWNFRTGEITGIGKVPAGEFAVLPDDKGLLVNSDHRNVELLTMTGKRVRKISLPCLSLEAPMVNPDGNTFAIELYEDNQHGIAIYTLEGRLKWKKWFDKKREFVSDILLSKDGRHIAATITPKLSVNERLKPDAPQAEVRLYDATSGRIVAQTKLERSNKCLVADTESNGFLVFGRNVILRMSVAGELSPLRQGELLTIGGILSALPDGGFSTLSFSSQDLTDSNVVTLIKRFTKDCSLESVFTSRNLIIGASADLERFLTVHAKDQTIDKIIDRSGVVIHTFEDGQSYMGVKHSRDYSVLAISCIDSTNRKRGVRVWRADSGWKTVFVPESMALISAFSRDSKLIAIDDLDPDRRSIHIVNEDGKVAKTLRATDYYASGAGCAFSPDGRGIVYYGRNKKSEGALVLWNLENNKTRVLYRPQNNEQLSDMAFSNDGTILAANYNQKTLLFIDVASGTTREIPLYLAIHRIMFDASDRFVYAYTALGTLIVNTDSLQTAYLLCTPDDWLIYTPDGYFDGSKHGGRLVAMVQGVDAYTVDQFAIRNNRPDIILKRLGMGTPELIEHFRQQYLRRLKRSGLTEEQLSTNFEVPEAQIVDVKQSGKNVALTFSLKDGKHGIRKYNVYVNDVPLFGAGGKDVARTQDLQLTENVELCSGRNRIEVSCINDIGAESYRAFTTVAWNEPPRGDLYYLAFGVSRYMNTNLNLRYADKDARDLWRSLAKMTNRFNTVRAAVYTNEKVTVSNVRNAKKLFAKATADDTVVLFIAGHGLHEKGAEATYYFVTHEADLDDLAHTAAPFEMIEDLLQGIAPRQKIFLMDTCESGEMSEESVSGYQALAQTRGLVTRSVRGIKSSQAGKTSTLGLAPRKYLFNRNRYIYGDLLRRSGAIVFSSCEGNQLSCESDTYRNGLFTAAIVEALSSEKADVDRDGLVSTDELRDFVTRAVASRTGNMQTPTVDRDNIYLKFGFPLVNKAARPDSPGRTR